MAARLVAGSGDPATMPAITLPPFTPPAWDGLT